MPGTGKYLLAICIYKKAKELGYIATGNLPGGKTIHILFGFKIKDLNSSMELPDLSIQAVNDLKYRLKPEELIMIIIDEVSFISPDFLGHIDKRLKQLTGKKDIPYGGSMVSILLSLFNGHNHDHNTIFLRYRSSVNIWGTFINCHRLQILTPSMVLW